VQQFMAPNLAKGGTVFRQLQFVAQPLGHVHRSPFNDGFLKGKWTELENRRESNFAELASPLLLLLIFVPVESIFCAGPFDAVGATACWIW
jgi:hypothetical protein